MAKYRQKPVIVDAYKWSEVAPFVEGLRRDVEYWRDPIVDGRTPCGYCGMEMYVHGWIDTLEGGHIVCPGDMVITGVRGEQYPCKPDVFAATYEPAYG